MFYKSFDSGVRSNLLIGQFDQDTLYNVQFTNNTIYTIIKECNATVFCLLDDHILDVVEMTKQVSLLGNQYFQESP
jgi:hypothetical protein